MRNKKKLWMGMARLVAHLSGRAGQAVEQAEGINLSEMTLMGQIRSLGGSARMVDLALRLRVSKPAITKIADKLERLDLLKRQPDPTDRRVVRISLTQQGKKVQARAESVFETIMQEALWDHITSSEAATIVSTLDKIQNNLDLARDGILPP
jgi:DNA-binding MarR family transcriptional regulator